jgi:hypothetical protein
VPKGDRDMAGKGSRQRPTDTAKFSSGYDRIFGNKPVQTDVTLEHEPGMSTSCLDCPELAQSVKVANGTNYKGASNKHIEGDEATNE